MGLIVDRDVDPGVGVENVAYEEVHQIDVRPAPASRHESPLQVAVDTGVSRGARCGEGEDPHDDRGEEDDGDNEDEDGSNDLGYSTMVQRSTPQHSGSS